ncbi:MAG: glycogen/starch synthase, partial [Gammaproteobacteria bacterium]|nr:glycogen/starch synthase [Gammaproteobacteria bacterium]
MKVLMYGWEFPPLISGGLGVACYAIVNELAKKRIDLTLVLPQTVDVEHVDHVNFISGKGFSQSSVSAEFGGKVDIKYSEIATSLYPYANAKDFKHFLSNETLRDFLLLLAKM